MTPSDSGRTEKLRGELRALDDAVYIGMTADRVGSFIVSNVIPRRKT